MKTLFIVLITFSALSGWAQQLNPTWANRFGSLGWDYIHDIKKVPAGFDLFGSFQGTRSQDSITLLTPGDNNAWYIRCDSSGSVISEFIFGGLGFEIITDEVTSPQGTELCGLFQDSLEIGSHKVYSNGHSGAFVLLLDSLDQFNWVTSISQTGTISKIFSSQNSSGNSLYCCSFRDSVTIEHSNSTRNDERGFVLFRVGNDGLVEESHLWKTRVEPDLDDLLYTDSLIFLTGSFNDTIAIGDTSLIAIGQSDIFVLCFNTNYDLVWAKTFGGDGLDEPEALSAGKDNSLYLVGTFENAALFENTIIESMGGKDIFLLQLNELGYMKWVNRVGGQGDDKGFDVISNNNQEIFLTGSYNHNFSVSSYSTNNFIDFAANPFGNSFIAKFDSLGLPLASYILNGSTENYIKAILVDESGFITIAGNFFNNIIFPESEYLQTIPELLSSGEKDAFLIRFEDICKNSELDAGPDLSLCNGEIQILSSEGSYLSYQWSPNGLINNPIEVSLPGIYKLIVQTEKGCILVDSIQVSINNLPVITTEHDTTISVDNTYFSLEASYTNCSNVSWISSGSGYFSDFTALNPSYFYSFDDLNAGGFYLIVTATNMCGSSQDSINVTIQPSENGIYFYPNPSQGLINIVAEENIEMNYINITNQFGEDIANIPVLATEYQYDLTPLPPGIYYFNINTNIGIVSQLINKI